MAETTTLIIGAGPAGLTAALELVRRGARVTVLEKLDKVGGLARTEFYKGYRFDIGGHRFYTKVGEVEALWRQMLGADFRRTRRLSRIYYRHHFFNYPLEPLDALMKLGLWESLRIGLSYLKAKLTPHRPDETFEQWVTHRFGARLYETFFKSYTEKVWGIPCHKIRADWAAQRIKGLSLRTAVVNAVFGTNNTKSLIQEFDYPPLGPGMMWERFQQTIEAAGSEVRLRTETVKLAHDGRRVTRLTTRREGEATEMAADHFISTMPLPELIAALDPPPPAHVLAAARGLKHRDFILVGLIVNRAELFPDNWLYVHSPDVTVGRIQNFKNWSAAMVPDPRKTSLGMEYFCTRGDALWGRTDAELVALAKADLARLGLAEPDEVEDGAVIRQLDAYPVYDADYHRHLETLRDYLLGFENLQTIGRSGLHRYNNQDHSMLTGMLAARNIAGGRHDVWSVNTERSYYEEFSAKDGARGPQP
ncbi:MAG: NAD(P)/FAD-dependent oxidoreductase [Verrucomicrobia bacterium]|nr:NAD(P)/FAD-dependent oxidoreductase [Verrucomicrobiota bacterium]